MEVVGGIAEGGGEIDGCVGDGQQDIKIFFQLRDFVQGHFTGQGDDGFVFLFCAGGNAMRSFSLQGLFVDAPFAGDDPVAAIEGCFKTGDLQKIINAADQPCFEDAVEAAGGATRSSCARKGGQRSAGLGMDDPCKLPEACVQVLHGLF